MLLLYHYNVLGYGITWDNITIGTGKLAINILFSSALNIKSSISSNRYELGLGYKF